MGKVRLGDVEGALRRKGFIEDNGKHRVFRLYTENGKTSIVTHTSHGSPKEDLGPVLISKMSKQLYLTKQEFCDLVRCPLTKERLQSVLRERGHLP